MAANRSMPGADRLVLLVLMSSLAAVTSKRRSSEGTGLSFTSVELSSNNAAMIMDAEHDEKGFESIVTLGNSSFQAVKDNRATGSRNPDDEVELKEITLSSWTTQDRKDRQDFVISVDEAQMSELLKTAFPNGAKYDKKEVKKLEFSLPNIQPKILGKVVDYLKAHGQSNVSSRVSSFVTPLPSTDLSHCGATDSDTKFIQDMDVSTLFHLTDAAFLLDIASLQELACAKLATMALHSVMYPYTTSSWSRETHRWTDLEHPYTRWKGQDILHQRVAVKALRKVENRKRGYIFRKTRQGRRTRDGEILELLETGTVDAYSEPKRYSDEKVHIAFDNPAIVSLLDLERGGILWNGSAQYDTHWYHKSELEQAGPKIVVNSGVELRPDVIKEAHRSGSRGMVWESKIALKPETDLQPFSKPLDILPQRVKVYLPRWCQGWCRGIVDEFNPHDKMHHITYDNGVKPILNGVAVAEWVFLVNYKGIGNHYAIESNQRLLNTFYAIQLLGPISGISLQENQQMILETFGVADEIRHQENQQMIQSGFGRHPVGVLLLVGWRLTALKSELSRSAAFAETSEASLAPTAQLALRFRPSVWSWMINHFLLAGTGRTVARDMIENPPALEP